MNLLQLRLAVKRAVKDDTLPTSEIDDAINRVLSDINNGGNYRFQDSYQDITTTASTASYTLTTTILNIGNVVYKPGTADAALVLEWADYPSAVAEGKFVSTGSPPEIWSRDSTKIYFDPVPDSAFAVRVYNQTDITALVSDSDTPNIPARYHRNLLVYGAVMQLAMSHKLDKDLLQSWMSLYKQAFKDMLTTEKFAEYKIKPVKRSGRWDYSGTWGNVGSIRDSE